MTPDQLRKALRELNGERDCTFAFADVVVGPGGGISDGAGHLLVHGAMLIPDEPDHLVKVTDGQSVFVIDAERIAFVRIGLRLKPK
jgi:hypothetical protein